MAVSSPSRPAPRPHQPGGPHDHTSLWWYPMWAYLDLYTLEGERGEVG